VECGVLGALGGLLGAGNGLLLGMTVLTWTLAADGWRIPMQLPVGQLAGHFCLPPSSRRSPDGCRHAWHRG
jgi:hypothetical protein